MKSFLALIFVLFCPTISSHASAALLPKNLSETLRNYENPIIALRNQAPRIDSKEFLSLGLCFTDRNNTCGLAIIDIKTGITAALYLNQVNQLVLPIEATKILEKAEIEVLVLPPEAFDKAIQNATSVRHVELESELNVLSGIPYEQWDTWASGAGCLATLVGCSGGIFLSYATGGLALFLAQVSCVGALPICLDYVRNLEKWSNYQVRQRNAEKTKKETSEKGGGGREGTQPHNGEFGTGGPLHETPQKERTPVVEIKDDPQGSPICSPDAGGHVRCRKPY